MNISVPPVRASEPLPVQTIDVFTDTRDILAHARKDAHQRGFADWLICDIDAHHFETVSWSEIVEYIEDPVVRDNAVRFQKDRIGTSLRPQRRSRPALSVGRRPHPAPGRPARKDRGRRTCIATWC